MCSEFNARVRKFSTIKRTLRLTSDSVYIHGSLFVMVYLTGGMVRPSKSWHTLKTVVPVDFIAHFFFYLIN